MRRNPLPAYYQVYQLLRDRIGSGIYPVGTKLPTDNDIMAEFAVGRHTARSAVEQLVAERLVRRFPGRGSFILQSDPANPDWSAQALEDLLTLDPEAQFVLHQIEFVSREDAGDAVIALRLPPQEGVERITWSRVRSSGPVAFCAAHLPWQLAARLPGDLAALLPSTRLIPLIEKYCGIQANRVRQVSSAVAADKKMASILDVETGSPLLLLQRTYFDMLGMPIYYSEIYIRSDRFQHKVELFRFGQQVELPRVTSRPAIG